MWLILLLMASPTARAQEPAGWVVIGAETNAESEAVTRAVSRAAEHLESEGQRVLTGPELDQRVAAAISRPFRPATTSEQSQLTTIADAVAQQVMYGDDEGTIRAAAAALAERSDRLAAIGRDDVNARRLGDLALYAVRAHLHTKQADPARRQAAEALRVVPDLAPPPASHPGDVRRLVDEQRAMLAQTGVRLEVVIEGGADSCRTRAQGRIVPRGTPLPPGAYQVQVECGEEPGRVHDVTLTPGAPISIDASLDAALGNRDGLTLRYPSEDALRSRLPRHVQAVASALRVANVLVVRAGPGDALTLERFEVNAGGARRTASARVALSANDRLPPALDALVAGRSVEIDETTVAGGATPGNGDRAGGSLVPPLILGAAGLGLVGIAIHGFASGETCVQDAPAGSGADCAEWERPNWTGIALWAGLGVAALTTAVLWIVLSGDDDSETSVGLSPGALLLRGTL